MNPFLADIADHLSRAAPIPKEEAEGLIEVPPDASFGDYGVPCFRLAKALRRSPAQIAATIAQSFVPTEHVTGAIATGPYVNFRVDRPRFFAAALANPAGRSEEGTGKTVVIDFSSPNIAKHLAYHHLLSTVVGWSLVRIFRHLGYRTVGINHLGDWGTTHGKLIAAFKRWGEGLDLLVDGVTKLNELYVRYNREGDDAEAREWFRRMEAGDEEALSLWRRFREVSLAEFQQIYDLLGVEFDEIRGESAFTGAMEGVIERLTGAGLTTISEGALVVDLSDLGIPPFFLRKADGATVYATRDLAAAIQRYETHGFTRALYVVDRGQSLHFRQLFEVLRRMKFPWADRLEHIPFGVVLFGGEKTGARKGNVVLLKEVLAEAIARVREIIDAKNPDLADRDRVARDVGIGAVVFAYLSASRNRDVDFVWERVTSFDGHTGPYVQYTHARAASILRKAGAATGAADFALLTLDEEWAVVRLVAALPERISAAAREAEPCLVAQHLLALCEAFSRYYNLGNEDPARKVLAADPALAAARLALVAGVREALGAGLSLLGMNAPEEM
jgi:arginyl-tRNA synthetase